MLEDCLDSDGASMGMAGLAVLEGVSRHCRRGSRGNLPVVSSFFSSAVAPEERETSCSCLDSPSLLVDGCDRSIEPPISLSGNIVNC